MFSPFVGRNAALVLLLAANLGASLRVLAAAPPNEPLALGIALRALSVSYAAASCFVFVIGALAFCAVELSSDGRACSRASAGWAGIHPGMKVEAVVERLGPPRQRGTSLVAAEQLGFKLHPLGSYEEGIVDVKADGTVASKLPDDEAWAARGAEWIPSGTGRSVFLSEIRDMAALVALAGLLALAVAAIVPFGARGGWRSWTLYTPIAAVAFATIYESGREGGWRYDRFLTFPMYALILAGWLVRLAGVLSAARVP
jgi:hypothetical protein